MAHRPCRVVAAEARKGLGFSSDPEAYIYPDCVGLQSTGARMYCRVTPTLTAKRSTVQTTPPTIDVQELEGPQASVQVPPEPTCRLARPDGGSGHRHWRQVAAARPRSRAGLVHVFSLHPALAGLAPCEAALALPDPGSAGDVQRRAGDVDLGRLQQRLDQLAERGDCPGRWVD